MSNADQIRAIEQNIKKSQELVNLGASLERLRLNKDFRKVVSEGYFEQEAIRLVHLKADPSMQTAEKQLAIIKDIDAIGSLMLYMNTLLFKAELASKSIAPDQEMVATLINEDDE